MQLATKRAVQEMRQEATKEAELFVATLATHFWQGAYDVLTVVKSTVDFAHTYVGRKAVRSGAQGRRRTVSS